MNTTSANSNVVYTMGANTFNGLFDGQGHRIYNLVCSYDVADGNKAHGLFNALGAAGVVKNLTVAGKVTVTGVAPQGAAVGGLVGYSEGTLLACTNRLDIAFEGSDANNITVRIGGLVGVLNMGSIGDGTPGNAVSTRVILPVEPLPMRGREPTVPSIRRVLSPSCRGGCLVSHAINRAT